MYTLCHSDMTLKIKKLPKAEETLIQLDRPKNFEF